MNFSDERLARRAAKGDGRAVEAIYKRHSHALYRFCLALAGNPQDAQDALQNTMVKVLRALPGEERQIQLKPWLYRIARNETIEVLRRRRDNVELDASLLAAGGEVADTAATRERLRDLFADLEQLPERQRAALVMRELAGLGFEQIGDSFGTSAAVARQTVYEARLGLREMEAGREMSCDAITEALSADDGRIVRRRDIRAHLRHCESCRAFRAGIERRRGQFAAVAPLPLALSAGMLQGALGAGKAGAAAGAAGGSALAKSAATVAVVAAIGVTAADRGGLIDVPVIDGGASQGAGIESAWTGPSSPPPTGRKPTHAAGNRPTGGSSSGPPVATRGSVADDAGRRGTKHDPAPGAGTDRGMTAESGSQAAFEEGAGRGQPEGLPPASRDGQETAAANKPPQAAAPPGPGGSGGGEAGSEGRPESSAPPVPLPPQGKGADPPGAPAEPPEGVQDAPGKGISSGSPR